jgi:two-component system sensor histidine kinase PrrB
VSVAGSLRGRVAVLATAAVAVVLAAVGTVLVATFATRERARLDRSLAFPPPRPLGPPPLGTEPAPERLPGASRLGDRGLRRLGAERGFLRVLRGGEVVLSIDAPARLPPPAGLGYRTARAGEATYRTLTRRTPGGSLLETGASLAPLEGRVARLRTLVIALSLAGLALTAGLAWWVAGLAVRPLRSLGAAVARVSSTRDLSTRLAAREGVEEIDAVAESVNAMLARLERSATETEDALEATRRFAADAGHELRTPMTALRANLDALARNPAMLEAERHAALADAQGEADAAIGLLSALQTLARGDAGAALPRERVDLAELADAEVERVRRRHPRVELELRAPQGPATLEGWPDGLRSVVANLLENAAVHGRSDGRVELTLAPDDGGWRFIVDDEGPGVPPDEREQIFERFGCGSSAAGGSGLGLALVRQQARLHGGDAWVEESARGGARFVTRLGGLAPR